jgi:GMP synthase (glutamine-hydrolysing)
MKPILIIDPFVKEPVNSCFNRLVEIYSPRPCLLWQPVAYQSIPSFSFELPLHSIIILGSASHIYHQEKWHAVLKKFLMKQLKNGTPVLGICFGHQLLADHFGGKVDYAFEDKRKILKTRKLDLGKLGNYIAGVSHRQTVQTLGKNLESLSLNAGAYCNDVIRHKKLPFVGIQPHIEASDIFLKNDCQLHNAKEKKSCLLSGRKFLKNWHKFLVSKD